jgi:hypothetical protein
MNNNIGRNAIGVGVAIAILFGTGSSSWAGSTPTTASLKGLDQSGVVKVHYRRGGAEIAGLALGLIGAAAAANYYYEPGYYYYYPPVYYYRPPYYAYSNPYPYWRGYHSHWHRW